MSTVFKESPSGHADLKTEVLWSPHSPDLSPLDFMVWRHWRTGCTGASRTLTIQQLKNAIKEKMKQVTVAMIDRTIDSLQHVRLPMVMKRQGVHLEDMLQTAYEEQTHTDLIPVMKYCFATSCWFERGIVQRYVTNVTNVIDKSLGTCLPGPPCIKALTAIVLGSWKSQVIHEMADEVSTPPFR